MYRSALLNSKLAFELLFKTSIPTIYVCLEILCLETCMVRVHMSTTSYNDEHSIHDSIQPYILCIGYECRKFTTAEMRQMLQ